MTGITIKSVITPNDQFIRTVFSRAKAYYIDIYQREYKWRKSNVETLLNDIEVRFDMHAREEVDPKKIQADVLENFEPYYLNTYLTHASPTATSIVDGQQRLTTLLLILIKLYKILKQIELTPELQGKTFASSALEVLIFERDDFGTANRFKIFNPNREVTFKAIIEGTPHSPSDETQTRIQENYDTIDTYFEAVFHTEDKKPPYDLQRLTYYICYLLDRISIVEIKIEQQKNVAMIFEVVNDRGLGLKPYEILKGKLIGNLPQQQKEEANKIWTKLQDLYYSAEIRNSTESRIDLDSFFQIFFRAKFADSENEYAKFEGAYHYEIYRNPKVRGYFHDFKDNDTLFNRIKNEIDYFARLYHNLRTSYSAPYLIFNKLLDQNQQYLLIMSGINSSDPDKEKKISFIAKKFDQAHTVIRLLDAYDSSSFQRFIYPLSSKIRNASLQEIEQIFDRELINHLVSQEVIESGEVNTIKELFTWERFSGMRNRWKNFSKYILMRIDRYLAETLDKPSYAKGDLRELEEHFNKSTRKIYGMHLEHIFAFNEVNREIFSEEGIFNESNFNNERNKLGVVLLLKDRQNESINNALYRDKMKAYGQSNFIWNELLVGHIHHVDGRKLPAHWPIEAIPPDDKGTFPKEKIRSRQRLLFEAIRDIWCNKVLLDD
ncbi:MAG: DUF262 domain-containing protein [Phaeodactylibacter sp.]|nr:DUF262 domain-containing protein [Phaeodactylibacter sp.]